MNRRKFGSLLFGSVPALKVRLMATAPDESLVDDI